MVERHAGTLAIASEVNKGSVFTVTLPYVELHEATAPAERQKRIVIVGGVTAGPKAAARLRRLDEAVTNLGKRNRAKQLWKILPGRKGIPSIDGNFTHSGRFLKALEKLLAVAAKRGEHKAYVVGVASRISEPLWQKASDPIGVQAAGAAPAEPLSPEARLALLPESAAAAHLASRFVGKSPEVRFVRELIMHAAKDTVGPVLLLGDTGTGKEVVAQCIHACSGRQGRFVDVNCGAISPYLFEVELFGQARRVVAGADEKIGLWKLADYGTLFLDEVADLLPEHQVKVLRALEEKRILPAGATNPVTVNAFVIAATNRDLAAMVKRGQFRGDLFYRLRHFCLPLPALQTHAGDIAALARTLWTKICAPNAAPLPPEILAALTQYEWPGNVRELRLVLSQLHELYPDKAVGVDEFRLACELQGKVPIAAKPAPGERAKRSKRAQALRHLQRAEDVLQAIEVSLRPLVRSKHVEPDGTTALRHVVRHRFYELTLLCLHRPLFGSTAAFVAVDRVRDVRSIVLCRRFSKNVAFFVDTLAE